MPHIWAGRRRWRTVPDTSFSEVSSAIHDVRYRLSWGFLIEAIETGGRALIPYRWEQIGSKRLTSSQMQMWSVNRTAFDTRPTAADSSTGCSPCAADGRPTVSATSGNRRFANGMFAVYVDPKVVDTSNFFDGEISRYVDFIRATKPVAGVDAVLIPGDPEKKMRADRTKNGVPLPDDTWAAIVNTAREVGVSEASIQRALS